MFHLATRFTHRSAACRLGVPTNKRCGHITVQSVLLLTRLCWPANSYGSGIMHLILGACGSFFRKIAAPIGTLRQGRLGIAELSEPGRNVSRLSYVFASKATKCQRSCPVFFDLCDGLSHLPYGGHSHSAGQPAQSIKGGRTEPVTLRLAQSGFTCCFSRRG